MKEFWIVVAHPGLARQTSSWVVLNIAMLPLVCGLTWRRFQRIMRQVFIAGCTANTDWSVL
jgi:hypothetical protein